MIKDYLKELFLQNFGYIPTTDQAKTIDSLCDFILTPGTESIYVLRGFAGTGKTSLVSALVKTMEGIGRECALMAPTGRAAKVLSLYADHTAHTVHKRIYRQKSFDKDSIFTLDFNMRSNILFICDEASMISNDEYSGGSIYGTGRLLDDMVAAGLFSWAIQPSCLLWVNARVLLSTTTNCAATDWRWKAPR